MISPSENLGGVPGAGVVLSEEQRQAVLLALARLAVKRPGWKTMLREIAEGFDGKSMFDNFHSVSGVPLGCVQDSSNSFQVVRVGDKIQVLHFKAIAIDSLFTLPDAVLLAAWLAVLADPDLTEFHRLAKEITK